MPHQYHISFPAILGIQAGRIYYSAMVPIRSLERMFYFCDEDLPQSMKAQRTLNVRHANAIADYVVNNLDDYVLPSLVVSIDGESEFEPVSEQAPFHAVGLLKVSLDAKLLINDGQHRRAGLIKALKEVKNKDIGYESISVVFFKDPGFHRSQQIFSDINSNSVKVSKGLTKLYDKKSHDNKQVRLVCKNVEAFSDPKIEFEKNSVTGNSSKLFAYNALHEAISKTLDDAIDADWEKRVNLAIEYWRAVEGLIPEWREIPPKELRSDYLCTTAIALNALGLLGKELLESVVLSGADISEKIINLSQVDWSKSHPQWEGRCLFGGAIAKNRNSEKAVFRLLKKTCNLPLDKQEKAEEAKLE